jgi:hypothetical protein
LALALLGRLVGLGFDLLGRELSLFLTFSNLLVVGCLLGCRFLGAETSRFLRGGGCFFSVSLDLTEGVDVLILHIEEFLGVFYSLIDGGFKEVIGVSKVVVYLGETTVEGLYFVNNLPLTQFELGNLLVKVNLELVNGAL